MITWWIGRDRKILAEAYVDFLERKYVNFLSVFHGFVHIIIDLEVILNREDVDKLVLLFGYVYIAFSNFLRHEKLCS